MSLLESVFFLGPHPNGDTGRWRVTFRLYCVNFFFNGTVLKSAGLPFETTAMDSRKPDDAATNSFQHPHESKSRSSLFGWSVAWRTTHAGLALFVGKEIGKIKTGCSPGCRRPGMGIPPFGTLQITWFLHRASRLVDLVGALRRPFPRRCSYLECCHDVPTAKQKKLTKENKRQKKDLAGSSQPSDRRRVGRDRLDDVAGPSIGHAVR